MKKLLLLTTTMTVLFSYAVINLSKSGQTLSTRKQKEVTTNNYKSFKTEIVRIIHKTNKLKGIKIVNNNTF